MEYGPVVTYDLQITIWVVDPVSPPPLTAIAAAIAAMTIIDSAPMVTANGNLRLVLPINSIL